MDKPSTVSDLYCFALVLTKDPLQARSFVEESVEEIFHNWSEESTRRMRWLIFQQIRQKALCQTNGNGTTQIREPRAEVEETSEQYSQELVALHELPEPSRSAMTLFCLESFSLQDLESFLDLSTQELGETLEVARSNLKRLLLTT